MKIQRRNPTAKSQAQKTKKKQKQKLNKDQLVRHAVCFITDTNAKLSKPRDGQCFVSKDRDNFTRYKLQLHLSKDHKKHTGEKEMTLYVDWRRQQREKNGVWIKKMRLESPYFKSNSKKEKGHVDLVSTGEMGLHDFDHDYAEELVKALINKITGYDYHGRRKASTGKRNASDDLHADPVRQADSRYHHNSCCGPNPSVNAMHGRIPAGNFR